MVGGQTGTPRPYTALEAVSPRRLSSDGLESEGKRPLRLLVFASKPEGIAPCQRFRLEQWAPHLAKKHGIELELAPFESAELVELLAKPGHRFEKAARVLRDFAHRATDVIRARHFDGAIIHREAALIGPAIYERILAAAKVPFFFDFDDTIWDRVQASRTNGIFARLHFYGKAATIIRLSKAVFAGNGYLAAYARKQNDAVHIVPTSIELGGYPVRAESDSKDFVVCWTGSLHTLEHFEHAREALERLAERRSLVVKVICNKEPDRPIRGAKNEFVPWSAVGEADAVGNCHAGIMPLPDTHFTRGKCGLKALQFMATGRPVVVSPVGMNKDLIENGRNGLLASTTDEWVDALDRLAASAELRRTMGAAGRATMEERFSATRVSAEVARIIRATLS